MALDQLVFEGFEFSPIPAQLEDREMLMALGDDNRAGYLPFSRTEGRTALDIVDYLDNKSQYPAGLGNRLQEVYRRQLRVGGKQMAERALKSLAFVYGDFAFNAQSQLVALESLHIDLIDDHFNPNFTLAQDFPDDHVGFAPLVRYMDVVALRDKGVQHTVFNPIKIETTRTILANNGDDKKHKTIADPYTNQNVSPQVQQRINQVVDTTRVGEVRKPLDAAVKNEQARLDFWAARLRDTRKHGAAWVIGRKLLEDLEANS